MKRNPFKAVVAAVKALMTRPPAARTVEMETPAAPASPVRLRAHSKHGHTSLAWRRRNRPLRRRLLGEKFLAMFSHADHPLVAMARRAPEEIRKDKARARRWARNRLKKERAARRSA